jgi:hypothetical protein
MKNDIEITIKSSVILLILCILIMLIMDLKFEKQNNDFQIVGGQIEK